MKLKKNQEVIISDRDADCYGGMLDGRQGIIWAVSYQSQKYGVRVFGMINPNNKDGLYWIPEYALIPAMKMATSATSCDPIKRVIFNGNKTIVLWSDGTKTIVTCGEGDSFDEYAGFCAAVTKKVFGSTSAAKRTMSKTSKNERFVKMEDSDTTSTIFDNAIENTVRAFKEVFNFNFDGTKKSKNNGGEKHASY